MKNFKKQLIIQSAIVVVILALFITFFSLFKANISHEATIIQQLDQRKATLSDAANSLALLIQDRHVAQPYEEAVKNLIPTKDSLVSFSKDVDAIAASHSVSLGFSFGDEKNAASKNDVGSISFTATLNGRIGDITQFLSELEKDYYSMNITTLDMSRNESGDSTKVLLKGVIYYVNQ